MESKQPTELLKTQYKPLVKINQKLKNICDVYYISHKNVIFMHSLVDFVEKIGIVNEDIDISLYKGIMYLPNKFFEFTKEAKITKLTTKETNDTIDLGQTDDELSLTLNKLYIPNDNIREDDIINVDIIPQMYSKIDLVLNNMDKCLFKSINESAVLDIVKNRIVTIFDEEAKILLSLSKNIFPSIKKEDSIQYAVLPIKDENLKNKSYILYREYTEEISIYTLCAYLNI